MPRAKADANESLAGYMTAGVESWNFNPRAVVGCLLSQDAAHQKRIAQIVFHLIRSWGDMAGIGFGPEHPMHPEWTIARAMMANLSNAEFPA